MMQVTSGVAPPAVDGAAKTDGALFTRSDQQVDTRLSFLSKDRLVSWQRSAWRVQAPPCAAQLQYVLPGRSQYAGDRHTFVKLRPIQRRITLARVEWTTAGLSDFLQQRDQVVRTRAARTLVLIVELDPPDLPHIVVAH